PVTGRAGAAGGTAVPRKLTLAEAENLLLERNLAVAGSRYQVNASRAARLIAGYKPNPTLTIGAEQFPIASNISGSYPRFFSTNSDAGAQPTYTFRVDKIIERGGKRELRMAQADFQVKAAEAQLLDSIRTQLFQLRQAFTSATLARENLMLVEATEKQYEQTEKLTEIKVENGELAGGELYRGRAGRLKYKQLVLKARTTYEQSARDLLNLLGARSEQVEPPKKSDETAALGSNSMKNVSQTGDRHELSELLSTAPL